MKKVRQCPSCGRMPVRGIGPLCAECEGHMTKEMLILSKVVYIVNKRIVKIALAIIITLIVFPMIVKAKLWPGVILIPLWIWAFRKS